MMALLMVRRRPWGYLVERGEKGDPILGGFCNVPGEARVQGMRYGGLATPGDDSIVTRAFVTGALYCHRCEQGGSDPCECIRAVLSVVQRKDAP